MDQTLFNTGLNVLALCSIASGVMHVEQHGDLLTALGLITLGFFLEYIKYQTRKWS